MGHTHFFPFDDHGMGILPMCASGIHTMLQMVQYLGATGVLKNHMCECVYIYYKCNIIISKRFMIYILVLYMIYIYIIYILFYIIFHFICTINIYNLHIIYIKLLYCLSILVSNAAPMTAI